MNGTYEYKKRFYDLEKEERWLNEMSEKGLAFKSIDGGFFADVYEFELCDKKYVYRIDYNIEPTAYASDSEYIGFVEETYGAECVFMTGVNLYFRKPAEEGEFPEVYTNISSRIDAEKKMIKRLSLPVFLLFCNLIYAVGSLIGKNPVLHKVFVAALGIVCGLGLLFSVVKLFRHLRKLNELKKLQTEKGGE